ncbi:SPFH domain-containing protein [Ancylomarina euxinus]|uniref:SPFH domain-containing protein n=1 Tax=Ancylomarina euxinus TaxID=2283627 RepID=A0A425XXG6_9BACT|nr:SPFH domain-containing protein [Ancylomarina euxinus]MCZ4696094.1 SPFH domain-containing protein [Ancylomarina euxinus]MUP16503.1 SPFH domain-containing protein [Ancylomarina euxinus]RRG19346.1 SPFH domain-containing protein [Ancylomarina euxinus]
MTQERSFVPISGYFGVFLVLILILAGVFGLAVIHHPAFIIALLVGVFMLPGFVVVNPNQSVVLILFGEYKGTVKANGFFWVNPFFSKRKVSLRARNLDSDPIKVNDKIGNPIMIGVVLVWRVNDTFKATFDVNDYSNFVAIQSEAAIRGMAGSYPYDNFEDEQAEITLRSGGNEVSELLERELAERLEIAGIEVMEARINYLAYASEIAGAMLRRQQATAVVAARFKIVEGAVSMVEMALEQLKEKDVIELDEEKKATMVSSLMVVLCSDKDVTPVINTGSLYQ